ncbi:DsbE family thiol:disulfide interchange protein [Agrobacterium sp. fls2-241-TYG-188a]|uniref:DsbE family thiol:disulfide interchange protein n=1 Tax=Agrobacterium sp. fls2-241-TYG-188a TaxID=3040275 RepID=UPI00254E0D4E|nr:DsbE family thiol:disulfide interchange protein [Agrobacterium sp. fls2-241-TYG-188a]
MTEKSEPATAAKGKKARIFLAFLPLVAFAGFAAIAAKMLYEQDVNGLDVSAIPSALINTQAPKLALPPLDGSGLPALDDAAIKGKVTLVNVFASWCVPCRQEHPMLKEMSKDERLNVVGINYKDKTENALRFLGELGNPYAAIGTDPNGKAAIDWGVYGIPETYLVDRNGTIVYKKVGPIDAATYERDIIPAIEKAVAGD